MLRLPLRHFVPSNVTNLDISTLEIIVPYEKLALALGKAEARQHGTARGRSSGWSQLKIDELTRATKTGKNCTLHGIPFGRLTPLSVFSSARKDTPYFMTNTTCA